MFLGIRQVKVEADAQILAELGVGAAVAGQGVPVGGDDIVDSAALGDAAANHSFDAVLGHKVEGAGRGALDGLPSFHGQAAGARHQGYLLELVAAVRHLGRDGVILALMGKGTLVERLENQLDLLLEQVAVGGLVKEGRAEGFDFPGVVTAADAKDDPAVGQDVGGGKVLGQAEGVPHRGNVETAAELEVAGQMRQVDIQHQQVGDALVALGLEVVFRHPEGIVAAGVHSFGNGLGLVKGGGQVFVGKGTVVHRRAAVADIVHIDMAGVQAVKLGNHCPAPLLYVKGIIQDSYRIPRGGAGGGGLRPSVGPR